MTDRPSDKRGSRRNYEPPRLRRELSLEKQGRLQTAVAKDGEPPSRD